MRKCAKNMKERRWSSAATTLGMAWPYLPLLLVIAEKLHIGERLLKSRRFLLSQPPKDGGASTFIFYQCLKRDTSIKDSLVLYFRG